jgi:hypothetical protein
MKPAVRAYRPADLEHIAENMREADVKEAYMQAGVGPREAIERSLAAASMVRVGADENDVPVVIFGMTPINTMMRTGAPWLLGTDDIERNYVTFARFSVKWRDKMLRNHEVLTNFVHDEHEQAKRWLVWLGFKLGLPKVYGPHGGLFRKFTMEKQDVLGVRNRRGRCGGSLQWLADGRDDTRRRRSDI